MRELVIKARKMYRSGKLPQASIDAMLAAGKITQEEHAWILGDD